MKKLKIKRIFGLALLLLLLIGGSSWAANLNFTDPAGQWWSGSNFSITFDWSAGSLSVSAVGGGCFLNSTGDVRVSLNTDDPKSYSLDASAISNASGDRGPIISVVNNVWANSSDDYFVAWDSSTKTIMFYYGDQDCYTYLGLGFSEDLTCSPPVGTSVTLTASSVEAIVGQKLCNAVPIPGAIWLLFSGLFGLLFIRRKCESEI